MTSKGMQEEYVSWLEKENRAILTDNKIYTKEIKRLQNIYRKCSAECVYKKKLMKALREG